MLMHRRMSAADRAAADKASEWIAQVRANNSEHECQRLCLRVLWHGGRQRGEDVIMACARALSAVPGMSS